MDGGFAKRKGKRGRAMGEMLMGIRREFFEKDFKIEVEREGIIMEKVRTGKERWRIIGLYVSGNIEGILQNLEKWMEDRESGIKTLIGGDFNVRTGIEGESKGRGRKKRRKRGREGEVVEKWEDKRRR